VAPPEPVPAGRVGPARGSGPAGVVMTFDYPDFQTPQAHATTISTTGVPLLRMTNTAGSSLADVIGAAADVVIVPQFATNQPGYEVLIDSYMPASSGTLPFLLVNLLWFDSGTGMVAYRRDLVVPAGNAIANTLECYAYGPMHGDTMAVEVVNLDPAVAQTIQYSVNQTSHVYSIDEAKQYAFAATAPNGFVNPKGVLAANVVAATSPTIGAAASAQVLCGLYSGDVVMTVDNSSSGSPVTVLLFDPAGWATGTVNGEVYSLTVASGATLIQPLTLPFTPLVLKLSNTATAGSITPKVLIIGQQH
jgi:hypothetical protein